MSQSSLNSDSSNQHQENISALEHELSNKDLELQRSLEQFQGLEHQNSLTKLAAQKTEERCAALVKERKAVQTIMEHKVQVLVNEVAKAAQLLVQGNSGAIQKIGKELAALQRLVGASIQALRNAQHEDDLREKGVN
mmetsp:Transcript_19549/g.25520  ORF Transcript_19549/g.25520 Transcript_19549/m.25520 type:complete len:137 (-) Transcript_19549:38-448(-)